MNKELQINFLAVNLQKNECLLSVATGSDYKNGKTSYQNFGNENVTTRAGLDVHKRLLISALEKNLGIQADKTLAPNNTLQQSLNCLLAQNQQLDQQLFANLATVVIKMPLSKNHFQASELVSQSRQSAIINEKLIFELNAYPEKHFKNFQNAKKLLIKGELKIKLTDYRRVDETTLQATEDQVLILPVSAFAKPTNAQLISLLNAYFAITDEKFATPLFPIWNLNLDGSIKWFDKAGLPVKHSLNDDQIAQLIQLWENADQSKLALAPKGDFPTARVMRAVEKVTFQLVDPTILNDGAQLANDRNTFKLQASLTIDFIQHWSWSAKSYSDYQKSFSFPIINFLVKFI